MDYSIVAEKLSKQYWGVQALAGVDLKVEPGTVFGLLGRNGAGKSTLIKILMGMIEEFQGTVSVLGSSSHHELCAMRSRIGYVGEATRVYEWMTLKQLITFTASFYPGWDMEYSQELADRLGIPLEQKIKGFSRGMKRKVLLVLALSHRPELVVLDEPTAGIDALVRREFFNEIIDLLSAEGKTVFFASNNPGEVERLADVVGILDGGKLVLSEEQACLRARFRKLVFDMKEEPAELPVFPGSIASGSSGREGWVVFDRFDREQAENVIKGASPERYEFIDLTLEDIFIEFINSRGR